MNEDVRTEKPHEGQIMDLQTDKDLTFLISSSKDSTAKVNVRHSEYSSKKKSLLLAF